MQKSDGGVFNKLASEVWESGAPETSDLGGQKVRYFLPRTTHDTATAGAVFAQASRVWSVYNNDFSLEMLRRALLSWNFLQVHPSATPADGPTNPAGHISGPYPDTNDADNRAWLAAELYRTTCSASYGQAYVDYVIAAGNKVPMGGNDFCDYGIEGAWAFIYAACPNEPSSFVTVRNLAKAAIKSSADGNYARTMGNTYNNVGRTDVPGKPHVSLSLIAGMMPCCFYHMCVSNCHIP